MSEVEFEYEDDGDDYAEASSLVSAEPAVTQAQESQQLPDSDTVSGSASLFSNDHWPFALISPSPASRSTPRL